MIIDGHGHLSPTEYGQTERYLEVLKESGIDQGVVSPGGMLDVRRMNDYVFGPKKPDPTPRNDYVEAAFRSNPALHGFACVDPSDPQAPEKLERYLEGGFRGLLVSPLVHRFSFTDDAMLELATLCGEHGAPVVSHNGWRPGANTGDFVALARRSARTSFILEHMGAPPADVEAADAAAELDNFFLETSLGSYLHIVETVKHAGASKVIFGSEYPLSHPAAELKKVLLLPLTEREREMVLADNIRELLRL
jgi:predicted TIM-barrel fold metal-dependent hydrolase